MEFPQSLQGVDYTSPTIPEDLALDEWLLLQADQASGGVGLRLWEPTSYAVIMGRSNVAAREVNLAACAADHVPVLRRCSGGGAVVIGPGCLCFSLLLPITADGLANIGTAKEELLSRMARFQPGLEIAGVSDLVAGGRKFSGNAQRWLRRAFLHHGTLLYDFDLDRISRWLNHPGREPEYRQQRTHRQFVGNLSLGRAALVDWLTRSWDVTWNHHWVLPTGALDQLLATRYHHPAWHDCHPA